MTRIFGKIIFLLIALPLLLLFASIICYMVLGYISEGEVAEFCLALDEEDTYSSIVKSSKDILFTSHSVYDGVSENKNSTIRVDAVWGLGSCCYTTFGADRKLKKAYIGCI